MSLLGWHYSYFFFAFHLLDIAFSNKALNTILQSVTHNGRQLVLSVMLMCIVVYVYAVIAFNFFREAYIADGDEDEPDKRCHDMKSCFIFHVYEGIRSGGGIGDQLNPPGEEIGNLFWFRMFFDITFFFFVIVILLAILQGL